MLRLDQYDYEINFSTKQGPEIQHQRDASSPSLGPGSSAYHEMAMIKDRIIKKIRVDHTVVSCQEKFDELKEIFEFISLSDLDDKFYKDLNQLIIKPIFNYKHPKVKQISEIQKDVGVVQRDKYTVHGLYHDRGDIKVNILFPSHF